ncbi:MAG: tetratricopeptide repeat protein [Betaproteobacteria bacterium]|nr:tetratricopeptide repeat protein [Betaproteobacteria bacterium]
MLALLGTRPLPRSDWNQAETYYRKASTSILRTCEPPTIWPGCSVEKGSPDAVRFAQQLIQKAPDNHLIQDTVGTIYLDAGDTQNAVRLLEAAAKGLPNMASVKLNYARALIATNRKEDAHRQIELARPLVKSKASQQYLDTLDAQTR